MVKYYKTHKIILVSIIVIFVIMAIVLEILSEEYDNRYRDSIFPFFTWSLFKKIPNDFSDYGIIIISIDGEELSGINYYQDLSSRFVNSNSMKAYFTIQKMGKAFRRNQLIGFNELRKLFESYYLKDATTIKYKLIKRSFKPAAETKRYKIIKDYGEFEYMRAHD